MSLLIQRQNEIEADTIGAHMAVRAGYRLEAGIKYFSKIGNPGGVGDTHPSYEDRKQALLEVQRTGTGLK